MCEVPMMMGHCGGMGGKSAFLLIALAMGFWVLTLADNNPNPLRIIGRFVGWIILLVSLGGLLCMGVCGMGRMSRCHDKGAMDCHQGKMMPPDHGAPESAAPAPKK